MCFLVVSLSLSLLVVFVEREAGVELRAEVLPRDVIFIPDGVWGRGRTPLEMSEICPLESIWCDVERGWRGWGGELVERRRGKEVSRGDFEAMKFFLFVKILSGFGVGQRGLFTKEAFSRILVIS